jgi:hypothetical protein
VKLMALVVMIAFAITLLAVQATSSASTTTDAALRPQVTVVNELPTGPQHSQGPHPDGAARSQRIDHGAESAS